MKKRSKLLGVAKRMPPRKHKIGTDFDIRKSETVKWLIDQPEILTYIWDQIKQVDVVYNPDTRTWQGVDYHGGD